MNDAAASSMIALRIAAPLLVLSLAACSSQPPRPGPSSVVSPQEPPRNVLAAIRDQAVEYRSEFQVEPLREPAVAESIEAAKRAEMRGDRAAAEAALADALHDPEARQRYAELLLARGAAADAERLAREAWEAGAKVGEWCARSWLTIAEARELQHAPNGARQARERAAECAPPQVHRY